MHATSNEHKATPLKTVDNLSESNLAVTAPNRGKMGSYSNSQFVSEADIENVKNAPYHYLNRNLKAPVADDFMYAFKHNNPLPLHGKGTDVVDFTADDEKSKQTIAEEILKKLEQAIQAKDSKTFSGLFLASGTFRAP